MTEAEEMFLRVSEELDDSVVIHTDPPEFTREEREALPQDDEVDS